MLKDGGVFSPLVLSGGILLLILIRSPFPPVTVSWTFPVSGEIQGFFFSEVVGALNDELLPSFSAHQTIIWLISTNWWRLPTWITISVYGLWDVGRLNRILDLKKKEKLGKEKCPSSFMVSHIFICLLSRPSFSAVGWMECWFWTCGWKEIALRKQLTPQHFLWNCPPQQTETPAWSLLSFIICLCENNQCKGHQRVRTPNWGQRWWGVRGPSRAKKEKKKTCRKSQVFL